VLADEDADALDDLVGSGEFDSVLIYTADEEGSSPVLPLVARLGRLHGLAVVESRGNVRGRHGWFRRGRGGDDSGQAIAADERGRVTSVTGVTASPDYPTTSDAHDRTYNGNGDAFDRLSTLAKSTFLGGTASDAGSGIAVDEKGNLAHVTGSTASADYPTAGLADDTSYNGAGDAFLASLKRSNGALVHSTFLGGTGNEVGNAVAVGADRKRAYVTGSTGSTDFPSSPEAFDGSYNGAGDVFVASAGIGHDE
jgi:hypothetical protein